MLKASGSSPLHHKVLIIDSCSFCADADEALKTVAETEVGLLCGFQKDIEPIDSMVLEFAFVNNLLWEWWDGERAFDLSFLQEAKNPFGNTFLRRYDSLSKELGLRVWRWTGKRAEEIIIADLSPSDDPMEETDSGQPDE